MPLAVLQRRPLLPRLAGGRGPAERSTRCRYGVSPVCSAVRRDPVRNHVSVHRMLQRLGTAAVGIALSASIAAGAGARLEGVNKPELLPKEYTPVIDVAGFLTPAEERRIRNEVENLERDTGVKLRVLAQNYPSTPGLAIKDFWKVDADTVVFVADPSLGNILNFNIGANIDLQVPPTFWSRLAGKYGNKFFWQERGEEAAIVNAVSAIDSCIREPPGRLQCARVQEPLDDYNK